jgi:hypothetical protein
MSDDKEKAAPGETPPSESESAGSQPSPEADAASAEAGVEPAGEGQSTSRQDAMADGADRAFAEDAIDPDLLALGDEAPSLAWHRPLIMGAVCILIVAMMVWFRGEVAYFFSDATPVDLGEAHDAEFREDHLNRFVRLDGIPLAPRNQNPSARCGGQQGFPTYQRRFLCRGHQSAVPVMGRPDHDLIIQRFLVQQLRIFYQPPEGREGETDEQVQRAARMIGAVRDVRPLAEEEPGRLVVEIEGRAGQTNLAAVAKSIQYRVSSAVAGIRGVRVESVRREPPGAFEGRLVRLGQLGSRFGAVADYLNECTNYPVDENTWVVLDGSEAGHGLWDSSGLCYGHAPRQYWPYLLLYFGLTAVFFLNVWLLFRFFRGLVRR